MYRYNSLQNPLSKLEEEMRSLSIIIQETGWRSIDHLLIKINNQKLSIYDILEDPITESNFSNKKNRITHFLRCLYTELFKNYDVLLSVILHICSVDASVYYVDCMIQFFDSLNRSKALLNGLQDALNTLNKLTIWKLESRKPWNLIKIFNWTNGFLDMLNNNNYAPENLVSRSDNEKSEMTNTLFNTFQHYRRTFLPDIYADLYFTKSRCEFMKPFYDKLDKIQDFRNSDNSYVNENPLQTASNACDFFNKFCEDALKSYYEDLGFSKVDCSDKELEANLRNLLLQRQ